MSNPFNIEARLRQLEKRVEVLERDVDNMTKGVLVFSGTVFLPERDDATRGKAGQARRLIYNSDDGLLNIDNGVDWTLADGTPT